MNALAKFFKKLFLRQRQQHSQMEDLLFFATLVHSIKKDPFKGIRNLKILIYKTHQTIKDCFTSYPPTFQARFTSHLQYSRSFWILYFFNFLLVSQEHGHVALMKTEIIQYGNLLFENRFNHLVVRKAQELFDLTTNHQISRNKKIEMYDLDEPYVEVISQSNVEAYLGKQFERCLSEGCKSRSKECL